MVAGRDRKETAVLIHGLSETRDVWAGQVGSLQSFLHVIAYDVRGFGASPTGAADGSVRQMADDLAQVLSALQAGPVWLVGFSMGGVIAQRFALDFPELTQGLVLIASSNTVGRGGEDFFKRRIEQVTNGGLETLASINAEDALGCFARGSDQLIVDYQRLRVAAVREVEGYLNACRAMLGLKGDPLARSPGTIECPALVVAGELDPYCPPRASQMIATAIPGAELRVIPGAGHCLHWEDSASTNELIHGFIDGNRRLESSGA